MQHKNCHFGSSYRLSRLSYPKASQFFIRSPHPVLHSMKTAPLRGSATGDLQKVNERDVKTPSSLWRSSRPPLGRSVAHVPRDVASAYSAVRPLGHRMAANEECRRRRRRRFPSLHSPPRAAHPCAVEPQGSWARRGPPGRPSPRASSLNGPVLGCDKKAVRVPF